MNTKSLLVFTVLAVLAVVSVAVRVHPPVGPIDGFSGRLGLNFLGIKYATVPGRFMDPVPVEPWDEDSPYQAMEEGKACPQICELPSRTCPKPDQYSEDCLFINVYTPFNPLGKRLPVMVFFHGGNYKQGHGGGPLYNATALASNEMVVITTNYRLGALGYLVDVENGIEGNYGFKDQVLLLRFIEANISAFGGDPKRVTVFGQSAGGGSVAALASSDVSRPFLHRAIIMSNPFSILFRDEKSAPGLTKAFRKHSKCTTVECYREMSIDDFLVAQSAAETDIDSIIVNGLNAFLPYTPYVDGKLIKKQLTEVYADGADVAKVPIIFGVTGDESVPFIYEAMSNPADHTQYHALLASVFGLGDRYKKVIERYPGSEDNKDHREDLVFLANKFIFECSNIRAARSLQLSDQRENVWFYNYTHAFSFVDAWEHLDMCKGRACHATELPLTFGVANVRHLFDYTPQESELSYEIHRFLTNFAYTGNPNKGPYKIIYPWENFTTENPIYRLDVEGKGMYPIDTDECAFWDEVESIPK